MLKMYKGGKILVSVTCDKCKHKPEYDEDETIVAPKIDDTPYHDYTCPYVCPDEYYNSMPEDHDFCSKGERK